MICGTQEGLRNDQTPGGKRQQLLDERDERIVQFMRDRTPIASIAVLEGMPLDYCRKACSRLAAEHNIVYKPVPESTPVGLTEETRLMRSRLANVLSAFREGDRHQLEVCTATGLTQTQQVKATQRPNDHDWTIGQLERLARATGQDFTTMMLRALLTPEQFQKAMRCLSS